MAKRIQTWEGTRIPIGDGVMVPKGFMSLWVDTRSGIVGLSVAEDLSAPDLGTLLAKSCREPMVGRPRTPDRVRVNDKVLAAEVARKFPGIPADIGPTPELDEILAEVSQFMGLGPTLDSPPAKNILGKACRDPAPSMYRRLNTVGAAFLAARPWDHIDPDESVDVSAPSLGLPDGAATVVGHNGTHFGFALVLHRSHLATFMRLASEDASQRAGARLDDDLLMFDTARPNPKKPAEADVIRLGRDFKPASADASECELVAAVAEAFVAFTKSDDRSRPVRVGPVTLTLAQAAPVTLLIPPASPPPAPAPGGSRWGPVRDRMMPRIASWAEAAISGWEHHMPAASGLASPEFLWSYALFVVPFDARTTTAAMAFREAFAGLLALEDQRWLDANIDSAWTSYWSVVDTDPGRSMTLRDIYSEEVRTIIEVSASRLVGKHDLLCARLVTVDDETYLDIIHPRTFGPPETAILRRELAVAFGLNKVKAVPLGKLRSPNVAIGLIVAWNKALAAAEAFSHQKIRTPTVRTSSS